MRTYFALDTVFIRLASTGLKINAATRHLRIIALLPGIAARFNYSGAISPADLASVGRVRGLADYFWLALNLLFAPLSRLYEPPIGS